MHSQDGLVSCGGVDTPLSCATFSGGSWRASHTLLQVAISLSSICSSGLKFC